MCKVGTSFISFYVYLIHLSNTIYQAYPLQYNITIIISYVLNIYVALWGDTNYFIELIFIQIVMDIYLYIPGWPRTYHIAQSNLKLMILQLQL